MAGIAASKDRGLARVLAGLSIRHVGVSVAELLAQEFPQIDELMKAFDMARDDPEVGAIILTGEGSLAFCSGE